MFQYSIHSFSLKSANKIKQQNILTIKTEYITLVFQTMDNSFVTLKVQLKTLSKHAQHPKKENVPFAQSINYFALRALINTDMMIICMHI